MGSSEAIQVDIAGFYLRLDDVHVGDLTPEGDDFAHEAPGDGADDVEFVPTDLPYIHHPNLITAAMVRPTMQAASSMWMSKQMRRWLPFG